MSETYLNDPHWLSGNGADQGLNYCYDCAVKERDKIGGDCIVDGGWDQEIDCPIQCEICAVPLRGYLLPDGRPIDTRRKWLRAARSCA